MSSKQYKLSNDFHNIRCGIFTIHLGSVEFDSQIKLIISKSRRDKTKNSLRAKRVCVCVCIFFSYLLRKREGKNKVVLYHRNSRDNIYSIQMGVWLRVSIGRVHFSISLQRIISSSLLVLEPGQLSNMLVSVVVWTIVIQLISIAKGESWAMNDEFIHGI